jgi:hypothetical protein
MITEMEGSALLIPKPTTGHDPEPIPTTPILTVYLRASSPSIFHVEVLQEVSTPKLSSPCSICIPFLAKCPVLVSLLVFTAIPTVPRDL